MESNETNAVAVPTEAAEAEAVRRISAYDVAPAHAMEELPQSPYEPTCGDVCGKRRSPCSDASAPSGTIAIYGTAVQSIVDGPGLRYSVFTQGCSHACEGCHNKDSWDYDGGRRYRISDLLDDMQRDPLCNGLSISGGDPFYRISETTELVSEARRRIPSITVWIWSGFRYEELIRSDEAARLLSMCDVLVDGLFIASLKDPDLAWRGSSNQRVIDLAATRKADAEACDGERMSVPVLLPVKDGGDKPKRRFGYHPLAR